MTAPPRELNQPRFRHTQFKCAQAAFRVIKWGGSDLCQVRDDGVPTKPWPDHYNAVSRHVASYDGAGTVKAHLTKKGVREL